MRVLAFAQTAAELSWCETQARRTAPKQAWHVVTLGEAALVSCRTAKKANCLRLQDLTIDTEAVFHQTQELQNGLWEVPSAPGCQLLLAGQFPLAELLLRVVYVRNVVAAALGRVVPDQVQLPPAWVSARPGRQHPIAFKALQAVVRIVCAERGADCRMVLGQAAFEGFRLASLCLRRAAFSFYLAFYDMLRILQWLFYRGKASTFKTGSILLTNFGHDLERQFDVGRLDRALAQRCLVWQHASGEMGTLAEAQSNANLRLHHPESDREGLLGRLSSHLPHVPKVLRAIFPTLVTPLVISNSVSWIFKVLPMIRPEPGRLREIIGDYGLAEYRLLSWRQLAYSARAYAETRDVLRSIKPAALVTGDTFIVHRAMALAARDAGIPCLATSHGLSMWTEFFVDLLPLAQVHALFGHESRLVADAGLPDVPVKRIVCHDSLNSFGKRWGPGPKKRIVIVTSFFACTGYSWGWINGLFIREPEYEQGLRDFVAALASLVPQLEVIFKPHPTAEPHDVYDRIREDFPGTVSAPLRHALGPSEIIPADIVVFYNCVSTLFFTAVFQELPIIAHFGALTPLARRLFATSQLVGDADGASLARVVVEILSRPDGPTAREALSRARAVKSRFMEPSIGGINEALRIVSAEGELNKQGQRAVSGVC